MSSHLPSKQATPHNIYQLRRLEAVAARWDAKADAWDRDLQDPACHLNEDAAYQRFLDQLASVIRLHEDFCRVQGLIDAGCATGLVMARVVSSFAWGVGVDISPRMIHIAQSKQVPRSKFIVGDCFKLQALCPTAGAVVSRGVLLSHYGPKQGEELLRSARSSLVDGGFILWDFLNQAGRAKFRHLAENKTYFKPETICDLATRAGFRNPTIYGESGRRVRMLYAEG